MSLIEGIGDEVTNFFIVMSILMLGWLAWCSTNIAHQPLIRTVLIVRDQTPARIATLRANTQNTSNPVDRPPNLEITERETIGTVVSNSNDNDDTQPNCPNTSTMATSETSQEVNALTLPTTEEVLIEAMDSFNNEEPTLLQRSVKTSNTEITNTLDQNSSTSTMPDMLTENSPLTDSHEITIKLKFINDDQKLVTGSLKEMLGEFRRRHFQVELEARKSVRLIFNGRVLQPDTQTLEECGLFNECVVHCWVHQPRPTTTPSSEGSTLGNSSIYFNSQSFSDLPAGAGISSVHNEWDLSRFLVRILTIVLGLAWYSRYHYAQLFTATTTLALYALTAIFTVSLFSNFFPDQDNIRNETSIE